MTVWGVLKSLWREPGEMLLRKWNWKSAVTSSIIRALIFFFTNLKSGWHAASGAMLAEFIYRALTSGFYGSITQAFSEVEPPWAAGAIAMVLLPVASHSIELAVHYLRGTPHLKVSFITSVCFTAITTLFNLYAMRRGALLVGGGSATLVGDLRRMPRLIGGFLAAGPLALYRAAQSMAVRPPAV